MDKHTKLIENLKLTNSLSYQEIYSYLQTGKFRIVSYNKNSILHLEGDLCSKVEVVLSGKVGVIRNDETGNVLVVSEFTNDHIIGANTIFAQPPFYTMNILAFTHTLILEIGKEVLFELLCKNSSSLLAYLENMSNHALILCNKIRNSINKTLRERILSFVNDECKKQNSNCIKLPITKKELAERIGVQRTSLSRELAKMKKDGLILYDVDSITLL